jgi:hypothetical protein
MLVAAHGWRRNMGTHFLKFIDIARSRDNRKIKFEEDGLYLNEEGDIEILFGQEVKLNGRYLFFITLNKKEITKMFAKIRSEDRLSDIIADISKTSEASK